MEPTDFWKNVVPTRSGALVRDAIVKLQMARSITKNEDARSKINSALADLTGE